MLQQLANNKRVNIIWPNLFHCSLSQFNSFPFSGIWYVLLSRGKVSHPTSLKIFFPLSRFSPILRIASLYLLWNIRLSTSIVQSQKYWISLLTNLIETFQTSEDGLVRIADIVHLLESLWTSFMKNERHMCHRTHFIINRKHEMYFFWKYTVCVYDEESWRRSASLSLSTSARKR